jgi:hypothetical protein
VEYYLTDADDEEVLSATVLVFGDGVPWNSVEHGESFYHVESWLSSTAVVLKGETRCCVWAWEESGMEMRREGNTVDLEERTYHKHMQLKLIRFELGEFSKALLKATAPAAKMLTELKNCAARECGDDWRQLSIQWHEYVGEHEIRLMSQDELERRKALGNQKDDWLEKATFLGYKPEGRPRERRGVRLACVLDYLRVERFTCYWDELSRCVGGEG